jgi:hypothetical protein
MTQGPVLPRAAYALLHEGLFARSPTFLCNFMCFPYSHLFPLFEGVRDLMASEATLENGPACVDLCPRAWTPFLGAAAFICERET